MKRPKLLLAAAVAGIGLMAWFEGPALTRYIKMRRM